jgi:hypothetical protein
VARRTLAKGIGKMTVARKISDDVKKLPQALRTQALDFVECVESRMGSGNSATEDRAWSAFSVSHAMRGMESEDSPYSSEDLKEVLR